MRHAVSDEPRRAITPSPPCMPPLDVFRRLLFAFAAFADAVALFSFSRPPRRRHVTPRRHARRCPFAAALPPFTPTPPRRGCATSPAFARRQAAPCRHCLRHYATMPPCWLTFIMPDFASTPPRAMLPAYYFTLPPMLLMPLLFCALFDAAVSPMPPLPLFYDTRVLPPPPTMSPVCAALFFHRRPSAAANMLRRCLSPPPLSLPPMIFFHAAHFALCQPFFVAISPRVCRRAAAAQPPAACRAFACFTFVFQRSRRAELTPPRQMPIARRPPRHGVPSRQAAMRFRQPRSERFAAARRTREISRDSMHAEDALAARHGACRYT